MILNASHIAFACAFDEQKRAVECFVRHGYTCKFIEENVDIIEPKRAFMAFEGSSHRMAFLEKSGAISIEVNGYTRTNSQAHMRLYGGSNIEIPIAHMDDSAVFFNCLGFKVVEHNSESIKLSAAFPMAKQPADLILRCAVNVQSYTLDMAGFCSLCLLSSDGRKERETLLKKGLCCSEIALQEINGVVLDIFFVKGPSGEIVELISPRRNKEGK